ncbi:MAG: SufS family cysteine desulfurase [Lachnospiraceae bacterium]|nr:SufS family cysteine desulfurase [Lachnospiraceae bacterium]
MPDIGKLRNDFPILRNHPEVVYFDNAATAQRPAFVTEEIRAFYDETNANPLRGLYDWSMEATARYEKAREVTASFIAAARPEEIVFTRNTTESINLVAHAWGEAHLKEGDEIVLSVTEHHSNILPWQMLAKRKGASLVWLEPDEEGLITRAEYEAKITEKTALVAIGHVSNVLGVTHPVKEIISYAHGKGAVVLVDGAQAAPHMPVNVRELDADFYAFSGHKLMGPMGIGALYGKYALLEQMDPFLTGGEMIEYVTRTEATWAEVPHKFEAGTVNAADACGMARAIRYLQEVGFDVIRAQEDLLVTKLMEEMQKLPYIRIYGAKDPGKHNGIVTFTIEGVHPHDISSVLNEDKVCIRAGHHCAQPLMQFLKVGSTARASVYFYNTEEEADVFLRHLKNVRSVMGLDG